jgi:TetR/AcrR family transcriptional regulator, fatty acid metabolism regulator protein
MTSEKIISAARKLFEQKGYDQTSVRDIATLANVNVALINYHFESKENLFFAILEESMDMTRMKLTSISDSGDPADEKLRKIVAMYVEKIFDHCQYFHFVQRELENPARQKLREHIARIAAKNNKELKSFIETAQESKQFKKDVDVDLVIATMFGILHQTTHDFISKRYRRPGEKDDVFRARVEKYLFQLLLQQLKK